MNLEHAVSRPSFPMAGFSGRRATRDHNLLFNPRAGLDARGNDLGVRFGNNYRVGDKTYDSTGAFLVGELERLDQTLHDPLVAVSWGRDIDLREDVTIADEVSSFTASTFGSVGGLGTGNGIGTGKSWIGKNTTEIQGVDLDINKTVHPLRPWALEVSYTIFELESAARLGRPVDQQKWDGMKLKHQMDIDEQVYYGDTVTGDTGLVNAAGVTPTNVPVGASGFTQWVNKTPQEILYDFNTALSTTWAAAAWAVMPEKILIPPAQYSYLSTQIVSAAGNQSILRYLLENNLLMKAKGAQLAIEPLKWCIGAGVNGTIGTTGTVDRMVVYTQDKNYVRFPMTQLARTPLQYDAIYHNTSYFCRLGVVEVVYPQTIGYFDGI